MLVARRAHRAAPGRPGPPRPTRARALARAHRDTLMVGPHPAAAGGADHLRAQGRRLAGRARRGPPARCADARARARRAARRRRSARWPRSARRASTSPPALADRLGLAEPRAALAHRPRPACSRWPPRSGGLAAACRQGRPRRDRCWRRPRSARCARAASGRGGSSAMPHKRNPVGAVLAPWPPPGAPPGWSRRCSPRWCTSTSARPAPGTPSGSPLLELLRRWPVAPRGAGRGCSSGWRSTPTGCGPTSTLTPGGAARRGGGHAR